MSFTATTLYIPALTRNTIVHHLPQLESCHMLRQISNEIASLAHLQANLYYSGSPIQYDTSRTQGLLRCLADRCIKNLSPDDKQLVSEKVSEVIDFVSYTLMSYGIKFTHVKGVFTLEAPIPRAILAGINQAIWNNRKTRLIEYDLATRHHPIDDMVSISSISITPETGPVYKAVIVEA